MTRLRDPFGDFGGAKLPGLRSIRGEEDLAQKSHNPDDSTHVNLCEFCLLDSWSSIKLKGLILAQNERWRRGLGMQVEREPLCWQQCMGTAAKG
jgi:hypothetical protein